MGDWRPGAWLPPTVALDPAREGDDQSGLAVVREGVILELHRFRIPNTVDLSRRVESEVKRLVREYGGVEVVVVDEVALGGGVLDELELRLRSVTYNRPAGRSFTREQVRVEGFKSSHRAGNHVRFRDRRAEVFHFLATEFERGRVGLHPDLDADLKKALREELLHHTIIYGADDRLAIGSKDEIRKTLGRSPDLADSLMMAQAPRVPTDDGFEFWVQ